MAYRFVDGFGFVVPGRDGVGVGFIGGGFGLAGIVVAGGFTGVGFAVPGRSCVVIGSTFAMMETPLKNRL